jgi:hypothetical protein
MKKIKTLGIVITVLMILGIGWNQIRSHEQILVVMKCVFKNEENKAKQKESQYYKITKRFLDDQPHKLYISNPDYDEKNAPPYFIGIEIKNAKDSDKLNLKRPIYFAPDWYTFIPERKDGKFFFPTAIYVNRINLQMEELSLDDGGLWSQKDCEIAQESDFNNDYRLKVEGKKKELKF